MSSSTERWNRFPLAARALGMVLAFVADALPARAEQPAGLDDLVRSRAPYLLLDAGAARLDVRVSGYRFASYPLQHAEIARRGAPTCEPAAASASEQVPLLLVVTEDLHADLRPSVAPERLADSESVPEPPSPATPVGRTRPSSPPELYSVALDGNWRLSISHRPPTALRRFARTLSDGWRSLWTTTRGGCELRLTLDREDAKALHHRVRPGTRIAILSQAATALP